MSSLRIKLAKAINYMAMKNPLLLNYGTFELQYNLIARFKIRIINVIDFKDNLN